MGYWSDQAGRGKGKKHGDSVGRRRNAAVSAVDEVDLSGRPILAMFHSLAKELDAKHDRYERLVKMSRDITTESKRIIFLLHRAGSSPEHVTEEADKRLRVLSQTVWAAVANELRGHDLYQFLRTISPGFQEYVEACSLLHYLRWEVQEEGSPIPTLRELQDTLGDVAIPIIEAVLGLADVSGELMRVGISSLGAGHPHRCKTACTVLREIYKGFLILDGAPSSTPELGRKAASALQSLKKLENAWCNVKMRNWESASLITGKDAAMTIPLLSESAHTPG